MAEQGLRARDGAEDGMSERTIDEIAETGVAWCHESEFDRLITLARRGVAQTPQERINNCGLESVCFTEASEEWQAEKERLEARVKELEAQLRTKILTVQERLPDLTQFRDQDSLQQPSPHKFVPNVTTGGCNGE